MQIAIISDIHDHVRVLDAVLTGLPENTDALICCGDLCSPFIIDQLAQAPKIRSTIHVVFGNNDGDLFRMTKNARKYDIGQNRKVHLHGAFAELVVWENELVDRETFERQHPNGFSLPALGGPRLAMNHYPQIATTAALSGQYDVVCYGHNHLYAESRQAIGGREVLLLNPGTLMGLSFSEGIRRSVPATFAVYDTDRARVIWYQARTETAQPISILSMTESSEEH